MTDDRNETHTDATDLQLARQAQEARFTQEEGLSAQSGDLLRPATVHPARPPMVTLQLEFTVVRPFDSSDTTQAYHRVIRLETPLEAPDEHLWKVAEKHLRLRLEPEGLQNAAYFPTDYDFSDLPPDVTAAEQL